MKLRFKHQDFQAAAVNAVVDLFSGQEHTRATFSVVEEAQTSYLNELGVGNVLRISDDALTANMRAVQKRNLLPLTDSAASRQFCVEMETGTGKTYVYTKTIFELNRRYGFTKFIVVVPSVAIREGVFKSFQVTGDDAEYFEYDAYGFRGAAAAQRELPYLEGLLGFWELDLSAQEPRMRRICESWEQFFFSAARSSATVPCGRWGSWGHGTSTSGFHIFVGLCAARPGSRNRR